MAAFRFARVILHLFAGIFICAFIFPFTSARTHDQFIRRWSSTLLRICRIQISYIDRAIAPQVERALVISNHVSWLDIFVLNSHHACRFVAKSDIRSWPLLGYLCQHAGTIFIARGKQREVRRIYEGLVHQITDGKRIAFFPEGTTAAQGSLLPFHANLFEAAIEAQVPVQPFVVRYLDGQGNYHHAADFIGEMTFAESMMLILKTSGMRAELIRLPLLETEGQHRRDIAKAAQAVVAQGLAHA